MRHNGSAFWSITRLGYMDSRKPCKEQHRAMQAARIDQK
jgi:hypothetical protein